jgi:hypothetical protein
MNKGRRAFLLFASGTGAAFLEGWFFGSKVVAGRPEHFLSGGKEAHRAVLPQREKVESEGPTARTRETRR